MDRQPRRPGKRAYEGRDPRRRHAVLAARCSRIIRTLLLGKPARGHPEPGPGGEGPRCFSIFPREIYRAPRRWAGQTYKRLIYWNELERGGHFAALEQPEIFVNELRAAFDNPLFRERLT